MSDARKLRQSQANSWMTIKAGKLDAIAEILRQVRQDQQMETIGGKRLEG